MTGNRNAWRAPLAGLASVAMLATMGVAAGTANAADAGTVTLNAGNGVFASSASATKEYVDGTSGDGPADGKLAKLYDASHTPSAADGYVFTGWYTADGHQAVGVDDVVAKDSTLYAHYAQVTEKHVVTFQDGNVYNQGNWSEYLTTTSGNDVQVLLAPGDTLASWQYTEKLAAEYASGIFNGWLLNGAKTDFTNVKAGDTVTPSYSEHADTYVLPSPSAYDIKWTSGVVSSDKKSVKVPAGTAAPTVYYTDSNGAQKISKWKADATGSTFNNDGPATEVYKLKVYAYEGSAQLNYTGDDFVYADTLDLTKAFDMSSLDAFKTVKEENKKLSDWYLKPGAAPIDSKNFTKRVQFETNYTVYKTLGKNRVAYVYGKFADDSVDAVKVTYDEYWSDGAKTTVTLDSGDYLGNTLPTPTRDGYTFRGWYASDGRDNNVLDFQVSKDTKVFKGATDSVNSTVIKTKDGKVTFYAKWESTLYAELNDLLNLENTPVNATDIPNFVFGDNMYTATSWDKYEAARKTVLDKSGVKAGVDGKYAVSDEDMSEAEAKGYVDTLSAAKAALVVVPELAGAYTDVDALTPHYTDILSLTAKGVVKGYPDGTFRGMDGLNRQDFAAYLYRLAGEPEFDPAKATKTFADVDASTPHYKAIMWAASNGIVNGYGDVFKGMDLINRQDAAAMLYRLAGSPTFRATSSSFSDVKAGDEANHATAVLWAASKGIVRGYADGSFGGMSTIVRQDAAAFLNRTTVADYLK